MHVFRRDELHVMTLTLSAAKLDTCSLSVDESKAGALMRRGWLGSA